MRATDGRPYELQSVPTKTVAIRTTGNCAILVQKFCAAPCLPLEGKVSAKLTEGSFFRRRTDTAADTFIEVSRPVTYGKTGTAGDRWSPLRVKIGSDQDRGNSHHGKLCYISAKIISAPCRELILPIPLLKNHVGTQIYNVGAGIARPFLRFGR